MRLLPPEYRPWWRQILFDIGRTLQWWLLGQSIDMLVVGVLAWLGLQLLGSPLPLALGVLAGLFHVRPVFRRDCRPDSRTAGYDYSELANGAVDNPDIPRVPCRRRADGEAATDRTGEALDLAHADDAGS